MPAKSAAQAPKDEKVGAPVTKKDIAPVIVELAKQADRIANLTTLVETLIAAGSKESKTGKGKGSKAAGGKTTNVRTFTTRVLAAGNEEENTKYADVKKVLEEGHADALAELEDLTDEKERSSKAKEIFGAISDNEKNLLRKIEKGEAADEVEGDEDAGDGEAADAAGADADADADADAADADAKDVTDEGAGDGAEAEAGADEAADEAEKPAKKPAAKKPAAKKPAAKKPAAKKPAAKKPATKKPAE